MRAALLLSLLCATHVVDHHVPARLSDDAASGVIRLAGLSDTVPGLFLRLVNDKLKGQIQPRSIRYQAPSSVVLEDAVLLDPHGDPVARVTRGSATLSLSSLLLGEIVISKIDLESPKLLLGLHSHGDERVLNLIEALTPKKKPEQTGDSSGAFRIDSVVARGGGFRFVDGENITITADEISASALVEVDLLRETVLVDVRDVKIAAGSVKLPELDVPVSNLRADTVKVLTDRLDVRGVQARVAGASVEAWGSLGMKPPGDLGFSGRVRADADAWPDRLKRLPFHTPPITANVKVTGPYENPLVRVDGDFARAELYGYVIESGHALVEVTKERVRLLEGTVARAGAGTARVMGAIELPSLDGDLDVRAHDVDAHTALSPAKLDPIPRGVIGGRARIRGVFDGKAPLTIDANASARRLHLVGIHAPGEVTAVARIVVDGQKVRLERVDVRGPGAVGEVSGVVDNDKRRLDLDVGITVDTPLAWLSDMPAELVLERGSFDGSVRGSFDNVRVVGHAAATRGDAWGVPVADVVADVDVAGGVVQVSAIRGRAAGATVESERPFSLHTKEPRRMSGAFSIRGADLSKIARPDGKPLPIAGRMDGAVEIGGTTAMPLVKLRAAAGGARVADEVLGDVVARGVATKDTLTFDTLDVRGPFITARASSFSLRFKDYRLDARAAVDRVDLAHLHAGTAAELQGTAQGSLVVSGDARAPTVRAALHARDVRAGAQRFGDGAVHVGLDPDVGKALDHVVTGSVALASEYGMYDVQVAYAIERSVLALKGALSDVDLGPVVGRLDESVARFQGFGSGVIALSGPLDRLSGRATLRIPELAVPLSDAEAEGRSAGALPPLRPLGEVLVEARLNDSELAGRVCAFPGGVPQTDSPCLYGERVWATVSGSLDLLRASFDLSVDAYANEASVEDLVPALATRGFRAGLETRAAVHLTRPAAGEGKPPPAVEVAAEASLLRAHIVPPGAPSADLRDAAQLSYVDKRVTLETPARFVTESGDADLVLSGSAGADDIDAAVEGAAALGLLKLFSREIANASSTADLKLKIRGKYADGVAIEGSVTPTPGAVITPRSLGEAITFLGGSLSIAPAGPRLFRLHADSLRARIGDGDILLRGALDVRSARAEDEAWVKRFDLVATGGGVSVRRGETRGEGSFDLVLEGDEHTPKLRGRVEVTEGSYKKSFELRNFILAAAPEKAGEPLWHTLEPYGLSNLELDVSLLLSNFRVLAKITTFSADMSLRGNMRLRRTLRVPQLEGAIEIEEGRVDFPRARFDITEMQLEFPPRADGKLSPLVHLAARAEIPPGGAGVNDTEIPIDLALDGSLEEGLRLDLSAIDPSREWSRSDLLGLVLFGKSFQSTVASGDANVAVRALLREATAPLTRELEDALLASFGFDVELDATGWRWQLGRRLELEGAGILIDTGDSAAATAASAPAAGAPSSSSNPSSYSTDAVRLRFLVLDHLPVGRNLSFVSRAGLGGSEVRLSLRLLEQ